MDKVDYNWFVTHCYHQIKQIDEVETSDRYLFELVKRKSLSFNNVVFGVTVLSMPKRIMNEVMRLAEENDCKIYYQDTDSMHIELDKLPLLVMKYKELYWRELIGENIIGCLNNNFDELSNAYATLHISLGKKMYYDKLENNKGETAEHFRLKGIPQDVVIKKAKEMFVGSVEKLYLYLYEKWACF